MLYFILLAPVLAAQGIPAVIGVEPSPAKALQQSVEASCGGERLKIRGFGVSTTQAPAVIDMNGDALDGALADLLATDLSAQDAIYRITIRCDANDSFLLSVYRAKPRDGENWDYDTGFAVLRQGNILEYEGLARSNESSFWFR